MTPGALRIAVAYYATYVVLGLMLTSIGPSLDALQAQSGSTTAAIAFLFTANSLGYLGGSLLGGLLYARVDGHRVLAATLLLLALFTVAIPATTPLALLLLVFAVVGVALGVIDVGGNTLIVWLYRDRVPPYMNALHLAFGYGGFAGPLVFAAFDEATGSATTTFALFAALMVPMALWLARLPSPAGPATAQAASGARGVLRRYAILAGLLALFFFMHMGAELAFGGWIYTYAGGLVDSSTTARLVNSAFWGGLVLGRLVAVPLALRLSPRAMIGVDLAGTVLSLALLGALPGSTPALWLGTIGFGFFVASLIPSTFNLAERRMPITSQVSSVFLVGGSLGSMTLPWLVGQLFVPWGPLSVIYVTGAAMLAAAGLFAVIVRYRHPAETLPGDAPETSPGA